MREKEGSPAAGVGAGGGRLEVRRRCRGESPAPVAGGGKVTSDGEYLG
ncbi:hypothetical protein TIFTF001_056458 [Ficus carica]|uniref:Uncharacterized protein n=1 Tax=Ficus carica TaxID=3494 RepID=A0AA88JK20_FICCA|nr:hypothetical protein TIFTF001_056458 [Ficus carica]